MRLRFGSWRLPFMNLVFFIILFIVLSCLKIFIFAFNIPNTSLFFGLYVEINGVMFISTSLCVFNKVFLGISIAFKMPVLITWHGWCLHLKVDASSCRRIFSIFESETIVQILRASEKGMFVLVVFGWQELKLRYCFESVLLK